MQNNNNDSELGAKFLYNSLLFACILKKKTPEHKIAKIKKYLERGADINAIDANCNNNTPLHLAVIKEEPEIVEFLLEKGAQYKKKNYSGKSALDIAHSLSGNLIKRKEIITLLETFADNNLKLANAASSKPRKRPGCPFIISTSEEVEEASVKISNTRDSKDFEEYLNTKNKVESKSISLTKKQAEDIENYLNHPHCSKDYIFSSPRDTDATLTKDENARIDDVIQMLENLSVRGIDEMELKKTDKQLHASDDFKIPFSNQSPDAVSTRESNCKPLENKDASVENKKPIESNYKQPQRKISYIQKNIMSISKNYSNKLNLKNKEKSKPSMNEEKNGKINDKKPAEIKVKQLQSSKHFKSSSSPKNTIGIDFKTYQENNASSAKDKKPVNNDLKLLKTGKDFKIFQQRKTELTSAQKCDSSTSKSKIGILQSKEICDTRGNTAIIGINTRINSKNKVDYVKHTRPVKTDLEQSGQSKYLKISASHIGATLSQNQNKTVQSTSDGAKIKTFKDNEGSSVKMKDPVKSDFKQLYNRKHLKISSQQHISKKNKTRASNRNENFTKAEGVVLTYIDTVSSTGKEVGLVKDSKRKLNDLTESQDCKDLKIASTQQDTVVSANSKSSINEEETEIIESQNIYNVEIKTVNDKKVGLVKNKNPEKKDLIKPRDTKDFIISFNENQRSDPNTLKSNKNVISAKCPIASVSTLSTNDKSPVQINSFIPLQNNLQDVECDSAQRSSHKGSKHNDNNKIVKLNTCDVDPGHESNKENNIKTDKDVDAIQNVSGKTVYVKDDTVGLSQHAIIVESDFRQQYNNKDLKKRFSQQRIESFSMQGSDANSTQSKSNLMIVSVLENDIFSEQNEWRSHASKDLKITSSHQQTILHVSQQSNSQSLIDIEKTKMVESVECSDVNSATDTFESNKDNSVNDLKAELTDIYQLRACADLNTPFSQQSSTMSTISNNDSKNLRNKENDLNIESTIISDVGAKANARDNDRDSAKSEVKQPKDSKDLQISANEQGIEDSSTYKSNFISLENTKETTGICDSIKKTCNTKNETDWKNLKSGLDKENKYKETADSKRVLDSEDLKDQKNVENKEKEANTVTCTGNNDKPLSGRKDSKPSSSQQSNAKTPKTKGETKKQKSSGDNKGKKEGSAKDKKSAKNEAKQVSNDKKSNKKKAFLYPKRTGTSGLSGQLYETKLLTLILLRSLYVQEVPKFFIGTNVENVGAFDDVIFRYYSGNDQRPIIMFLQAKHRDNPEKEKFTVDDLKKLKGDFSLHKYLESYIQISQMFTPDTKDDMFIGEFKNIDCEFIIYTSAFENFSKIKEIEQSKVKSFINTTGGKVFQFKYDEEDVNDLVVTVVKSRAVMLAKRLSKFIFKDNNSFNNMMMDDLIKTYHVFLAKHIIEVQVIDEEAPNFYYAKFRDSFLTSNDTLYLAFKTTLCKEAKSKGTDQVEEEESILDKPFKVPIIFGNLNFNFIGDDKKKEKKLEYLCSLFKKLFQIAEQSFNNTFIKIDDENVGPNEIIKSADLETYRIGGLVGNLLILDKATNTLKFNFDLDSLSPDNIKLLDRLRNEIFLQTDPSKYRFDINVHKFPRLSLVHEKYDKGLIKDFLDKLIFYTNQATEDKVEEVVKSEIDRFFVGKISRQRDQLFKVKSHAIFLKAHDLVQKWWKTPTEAPYLTESCKYFLEAEQNAINSPLLNILNYTYTKTIKNTMSEIKFKNVLSDFFHLNSFLEGPTKITTITTKESALTSMKLLQNFKESHYSDYTFINLDYVACGNYFADVKIEVKESKIQTLIIVCKSVNFFVELNLLIKHFEGKVILISCKDVTAQLDGVEIGNISSTVDRQIGFEDLDDTLCEMLRNERYIIFQGKEVKLGVLFEDHSYQLLNSNILYKIINNENTTVGRNFNNPSYDEMLDYYIREQVCRYVTLEKNIEANDDFDIVEYNKLADGFDHGARDVVLITDNEEDYVNFNVKYENCNVHWFRNDDNALVWQKSRGSLSNILKYVKRSSHETSRLKLETLKDLKEKVVIISAEPGMGKSSLLTYLAISTKNKHPTLWISKINLLDFTNEFKSLKENKINIDFEEVVKFLFRAIGFKASRDKTCNFEFIIDQIIIVNDRDICLNMGIEGINVNGLDLFEIQLFIHCFNTNRVALLFDGFDEICPDYASEFMQIAKILRTSKLAHFWITSRLYNVLNQLESVLQTFSFTIEPLSEDDQKEFLEKIWLSKEKEAGRSKLLNYFPFNKSWFLKQLVKGFLVVLSAVLTDTNRKFISMPLHLYMIAEIFQDSYHTFPTQPESYESFISQQKTMNKINLNQIYERFIDIKFFKIRFGEKKPLLCINDPDMQTVIKNERESFFYNHKMIAAYLVFDKRNEQNLFDKNDIMQIQHFIERIKLGGEKTGIIEQIISNEPRFVHYTFAEYFATEFLCDRLMAYERRSHMWTYLINIFLESDVGGPQRFLNGKLGNHPTFYSVIHHTELKPMFEKWIEQHEKMAKLIFMAVDPYLENTALFLLKCIEYVLTNKNINDFIKIVSKSSKPCVLCIATKRSAENVVDFILQAVKNVNASRIIDLFHCCDLPYSNPLLIAYGHKYKNFQNVVLLLKFMSYLPPDMVVEVCCIQFDMNWFNRIKSKNYIHIVSESLGDQDTYFFSKTLDKLNEEQCLHIFTIKDSDGKLAAHRAASSQSYYFFYKLENLLNKLDFKKICMTQDKSGLTPLHYFKYTSENGDKLERLLDKVYGDEKSGKLTLKYFIDELNQ